MTNISTDYSGRTVDILIFQNTSSVGEKKISLGFGGSGFLTTGIQKAVQTFTTLFLTEKGTIYSEPTRGTSFLTAVRNGRINDESTVKSEFSLAADLVIRFLSQLAKTNNTPDDEYITAATLQSFNVDSEAGNLILYVNVVSSAGTNHDIYMPISTTLGH